MGRPGFTRHPKFRRLAHVLEREHPNLGDALARGYLEAIWETAYENGDDYIGDAVSVEAVADWRGTPGLLFDALRNAGGPGKVGFIEESPEIPGGYRVHDLFDHAPKYVRTRMANEFKRQEAGQTISGLRAEAAKKRWANANGLQTRIKAAASAVQPLPPPAPAPAPAPALEQPAAEEPPPVKALARDETAIALFVRLFAELRGGAYHPAYGRDRKALRPVLALPEATDAEIERRMRIGFGQQWFRANASVPLFASKWSNFDGLGDTGPPVKRVIEAPANFTETRSGRLE
jgi:hypothetical protein